MRRRPNLSTLQSHEFSRQVRLNCDRRQIVSEPLADESIDRRLARACERVRAHAGAKRRELFVRLERQRPARRLVEQRARLLQELPVQGFQPIDQRLPGGAAERPRARARWSSSVETRSMKGIERRIERPARTGRRQAKQNALEMFRE